MLKYVLPEEIRDRMSVAHAPALLVVGQVIQLLGLGIISYGIFSPQPALRGTSTDTYYVGALIALVGLSMFLSGVYGFLTAAISYFVNRTQTVEPEETKEHLKG